MSVEARDRRLVDLLLTAQRQLELAECCYGAPTDVIRLRDRVGAKGAVRLFYSYSVICLLEFSDHVHISVGGSDDRHDWVQNFSAEQVMHCGWHIHSGFKESALALRAELEKSTSWGALRHKKLIIGGHSAGGAIAQAMAAVTDINPAEVYSFGSPRVFSIDSAYRADVARWPHYRFVMPHDVVPHLPLRRFRHLFQQAKYAHCGLESVLFPDGEVMDGNDLPWTEKASRVLGTFILWCRAVTKDFGDGLATLRRMHAIENYSDAIAAAIRRAESR